MRQQLKDPLQSARDRKGFGHSETETCTVSDRGQKDARVRRREEKKYAIKEVD